MEEPPRSPLVLATTTRIPQKHLQPWQPPLAEICVKYAKNGWPSFYAMGKPVCLPVVLLVLQFLAGPVNPQTAKYTAGTHMNVTWGGVLSDGTNGGYTRILYAE